MKKYIIPLLLITEFYVNAQSLEVKSNCITNPPDFNNLSYEKASEAVNSQDELINRGTKVCREYTTNLLNQLENEQLRDDNKVLAIYLLGELRPNDSTSIEALIKYIDFRAIRFDLKTDFQRWGTYPAEEALIKIGKPVIDPILNHLPKETSELRRQLMCNVIKQVLQHK